MKDLLYLMSRLRDPQDGCPWDRAQDFRSVVPHTIEESYELADAIERGDFQQIKEELGDVLFQVIFYAQLGDELNQFSFPDIVTTLVDKLVRRHPHVFPGGELRARVGEQTTQTEQVKQSWEAIKAQERERKQQPGILDDIPIALPALSRAMKLQKRASQVGFDWSALDGVIEKLKEEIDELQEAHSAPLTSDKQQAIELELGDILFCCVNLARHLSVDPEAALRRSNGKFDARFRYIEQQLAEQGLSPQDASLVQMDDLWDEAKRRGL